MSVQRLFRDIFGCDPVASGRARGRVNLLGDHTDYNQGYVLPTLIPQWTEVDVALGHDRHAVYSETLGEHTSIGAGPLEGFGSYVGGCIRVLEKRGITVPPLKIRIASAVPVGSGLSSSAALEVATLRAIDALLGLALPPVEIAKLAHAAEVDYAGVACGIMDQMACSVGELGRMLFLDTQTLDRRLLPLPGGSELLVIDSGLPHALVASAYNERRTECETAAAMLGVSSLRVIQDGEAVEHLPPPFSARARHVVTENARVLAAVEANAAQFGALMNESHRSLSYDYEVSLPAIDAIVEALQAEPACFGARITGAGFGGCSVALVHLGAATDIAERFSGRRFLNAKWSVVMPFNGQPS
jgi:galactokinase